ncbi:MAG TPA: hypothetical protein VFM46_12710, partial [Pseudomonadales bacterium]|nr:hypothetical protein [Pseudomonadales bacterium]
MQRLSNYSNRLGVVSSLLLALSLSVVTTGTLADAPKSSKKHVASLEQPIGTIPRLANGKPDFSGIWQTTSAADFDLEPHSARKDAPPSAGVIEGHGTIPYLPNALEQRKKNFEARATDDPRLKCYTLGVPRGIYYPEPFQIFQQERDLNIVFEFGHSVRTIHTNNTEHPDDPNDWWLGDSRGHWEGDSL